MRSWAHLLHITRDRQMVQFHNLWDSLESLLEVGNLPRVHRQPGARHDHAKSPTFLKWSPNLMTGVVSNIRASFKTS